MHLVGKEVLSAFKNEHPDVSAQVEAWEAEVENAEWKTPMDVKQRYPKASFPGKQQVIFDFGWNRYRLWVKVAYNTGIVIVKAIGTHKEYDRWPIE
jgi:mRNA interferase HigB